MVAGTAQAAGFRKTEAVGLADLVELDDPMGVATPDPLVVLLAADLAEQRPDAVLVLDAVQQALTQRTGPGGRPGGRGRRDRRLAAVGRPGRLSRAQ